MGMRIGNTALPPTTQATTGRASGAGSDGRRDGVDTAILGNRQADQLRLGFGRGTVSAGVAAVRTLSTNLDGARQLVPTVAELQAQARERAREVEAQIENRLAPSETPTVDLRSTGTQSENPARGSTNSSNDRIVTAPPEARGEPPQAPRLLDVRSGGETVSLQSQANAFRLDVRG